MRKLTKNKLLIGLLVLILVVILVKLRRDLSYKQIDKNIKNIPLFVAKDCLSRTFDSKKLLGKCTYVQFMNSLDPDDIGLLESVYSNWKNDKLNIVLICFDIDRIGSLINTNISDRVILIPNDDLMRKLFKVNEEVGMYFIFDEAGVLIYLGGSKENYECKAKLVLKQVLRNERFNIADFINPEQNIFPSELLVNIAEIIGKENREICVLSFFNKICDTCSGGQLIERLNELHSLKGNKILFLSIISDKYTYEDIGRLRQQLGIRFQVILSTGLLSQTWNRLIEEYCDNELTDLILVINKEGKIIKIADKNCNCYKNLFGYIEKMKLQG